MRIKSFYGENEADVIRTFYQAVAGLDSIGIRKPIFCGHNIREFDIPYLLRRTLINGIDIPAVLNFQDSKPWELPVLDTMQLWKFGDHKNYTSLNLLAACFKLPSPKSTMDGSKVGSAYWKERALDEIAQYCQEDVLTVARLLPHLAPGKFIMPDKVVVAKPFISSSTPLEPGSPAG